MMLKEALKQLDGNMLLRSHLNGETHTASEWMDTVRDESGAEINKSSANYGKTTRHSIYFPGVGVLFSQVIYRKD